MRLGGLYRETITLRGLVDRYLAAHQADPATIRKLTSDFRQPPPHSETFRLSCSSRLIWRPGGPLSPRVLATASFAR